MTPQPLGIACQNEFFYGTNVLPATLDPASSIKAVKGHTVASTILHL